MTVAFVLNMGAPLPSAHRQSFAEEALRLWENNLITYNQLVGRMLDIGYSRHEANIILAYAGADQ